jgi:hypothetical protein
MVTRPPTTTSKIITRSSKIRKRILRSEIGVSVNSLSNCIDRSSYRPYSINEIGINDLKVTVDLTRSSGTKRNDYKFDCTYDIKFKLNITNKYDEEKDYNTFFISKPFLLRKIISKYSYDATLLQGQVETDIKIDNVVSCDNNNTASINSSDTYYMKEKNYTKEEVYYEYEQFNFTQILDEPNTSPSPSIFQFNFKYTEKNVDVGLKNGYQLFPRRFIVIAQKQGILNKYFYIDIIGIKVDKDLKLPPYDTSRVLFSTKSIIDLDNTYNCKTDDICRQYSSSINGISDDLIANAES